MEFSAIRKQLIAEIQRLTKAVQIIDSLDGKRKYRAGRKRVMSAAARARIAAAQKARWAKWKAAKRKAA